MRQRVTLGIDLFDNAEVAVELITLYPEIEFVFEPKQRGWIVREFEA
jgi:hypothetical protein